MSSTAARQAGLAYLAVVLTGIFALAYVPATLGLGGGPLADAERLTAGEGLYRWGLMALLLNQIAFIVLPLTLFRLLHDSGRTAAVLMVALALAGVPLALSALGFRLDALAADTPQQAAMALQSGRNRMMLAMAFWGLWLAPLGWLVLKSGIAPRAIGVLLILGCICYLLQVADALLLLGLKDSTAWRLVRLPATFGEIGLCLWLVITGGRYPRWWPGQ